MNSHNIFDRLARRVCSGALSRKVIRVLAGMVALLSGLPAEAGTGKYNSGVFDFIVIIDFNPSSAQMALIEDRFSNGSDVLQWATHGQHRFGKISFKTGSEYYTYYQDAEFRILPGEGRAWATHGQYGVPDEMVTLFFKSDLDSDSLPPEASAFTIAHEFSHHAYDVRDEYSGQGLAAGYYDDDGIWICAAECAPRSDPYPQTPDDSDLNYCLMDNFFGRGGNFGQYAMGPYTMDRFCNPCSHDPDHDTFQESEHHESCWETIAHHPTHPANMPPCFENPEVFYLLPELFWECCYPFDVSLVIDRSNPMLGQDLFYAKQGANGLIDHLPDGTILSVISFGGDVQFNLPPMPLNVDTRQLAHQAIDGLTPGGLVNSGDGLMAAVNQLNNARPGQQGNEAIVFITGADQQVGIPLSEVLNMATQRLNLQVFTIGVGNQLSVESQNSLQNMAWLTSGEFHRSVNAADLIGVYERVAERSQNRAALLQERLSPPAGAPTTQRVLLEPGIGQATFSVSHASASDQVSISLMAPNNQVISASNVAFFPNVHVISSPFGQTFEVDNPRPGSWVMSISALQLNQGWVDVAVHASSPGVALSASATKPTHHGSEAIRILATPSFENRLMSGAVSPLAALPQPMTGAVLNATITATVHRPDGTVEEIALVDDGSAVSGDGEAADGTYTASYQNLVGPGTYSFTLCSLASGQLYPGEELFAAFAPPNSGVAPRFQRSGYTSTVVVPAP